MVQPIIIVTGIIVFFVLFFLLIAGILYNKSFKNRALIARQTGKDTDDVIWIEDRFRIKNDNGFYVMQFKHLREKTPSLSGAFWSKFISKKEQNKIIRVTKEQWGLLDLSKKIQRGLFLYETTEGEFFPIGLRQDEKQPVFSAISQNNRQFIINQTQDINSLTRSKRREMTVLLAAIISCFVLAVIFIFGIIYLSETAKTSVQAQSQACADIVSQTFNPRNETTNPQFLNSITNRVGG